MSTIVGNVYDKYHTRNPIAQWLMRQFLRSLRNLYATAQATSVLEVGCGETWLSQHLLATAPIRPQRFVACDLALDQAIENRDPLIELQQADIYQLPFADSSFDLVICCEVLEHLEQPKFALQELRRVCGNFVLISTPWEPVWRILNIIRGRYLINWGNTPGHIQHFSRKQLFDLVRQQFEIIERKTPLPWTVILARPQL